MFKDKVIKINLLKKYDIDNCKFKITDFKKDFEFELKELYILSRAMVKYTTDANKKCTTKIEEIR